LTAHVLWTAGLHPVLVIPAGTVLRVQRGGSELLLWPPQDLPIPAARRRPDGSQPVIGPRWGKLAALRPEPDLLEAVSSDV
jgi:hypothetical protein